MKQRRECLSTQSDSLSIVIRRYFSASFSTLLQAGTMLPLILMGVIAFTGATNLFGLNGSANATTSTITLSITEGLTVDVMPSDNGTFASSTATNNVRVKTDSASGYELGIKASTSGSNNNALINTTDSSKIIPSITESVSEADYSDASYASSHNLNNTWGFKPSKLNSQANSNYIPGPTDTINSIVLDRTTTANPTTFNDYTITLGTRIDNTQAPGSYANTFVITAFVNPTPYSITYNKNTTDTVTNMPDNVSSDTFSDQVTISNLVPARTGFNFKGWCTVQVADGGTCSGTTYNPNGGGTALTWTLDQTASSNSLNLYAMWTAKTYSLAVTFVGTGVTSVKVCTVSGNCSGANLKGTISTSGGSVSGLSYGTAYYLYPAFSTGHKIASWAKTSTTGTLSSTTANNPTFTMGDGAGAVKITPTNSKCSNWSKCIQNTSVSCGTTMTDGRDGATYTTATINSKCWMTRNLRFTGASLKVGETNVTSNRTISPYGALTSGNSYTEARKQYNNNTNYGAYYNFCAASAKTVCNSTTKATATQDICPAGWKLPTQAQFAALAKNESHFIATAGLAGYYIDGSLNLAGNVGNWWASTAGSATNQYLLVYYPFYEMWNVNSSDKYGGASIRCVRS